MSREDINNPPQPFNPSANKMMNNATAMNSGVKNVNQPQNPYAGSSYATEGNNSGSTSPFMMSGLNGAPFGGSTLQYMNTGNAYMSFFESQNRPSGSPQQENESAGARESSSNTSPVKEEISPKRVDEEEARRLYSSEFFARFSQHPQLHNGHLGGFQSSSSSPMLRATSSSPRDLNDEPQVARSTSVPAGRRHSTDMASLWGSMEALNLETSHELKAKEIQRSEMSTPAPEFASVLSESPMVPPQFSDKFLYDDDDQLKSLYGNGKRILDLQNDNSKLASLLKHGNKLSELSASSAALDLASLPQTSPRSIKIGDWKANGYGGLAGDPRAGSSSGRLDSTSPTGSTDSGSQALKILKQRQQYDENMASFGGVCRYYQQGYCSRGDRCHFAHVPVAAAAALNLRAAQPFLAASQLYQNNPAALNFGAQFALNQMNQLGMLPMYYPGMPGFGPANMNQKGFNNRKRNNLIGPDDNDFFNRFMLIPLEDLKGQIYAICKDQHGCRYLQKKLEENIPENVTAIFEEVFPHSVELMTDPFGNYLCQKLIEFCNDEQRTRIIESVAPDMVKVALNMHGTRAVQKMIEHVSNNHQVRTMIVALSMNVVPLIKDLNGNHVIQKCLNRLSSEQNQFIYNIVSKHIMDVATHRHGCCVLQRCIDHATDAQRVQLIGEITYQSFNLVQDPFGNYVVQYVLDLNDNRFTEGLIKRFLGNVCVLSVQKFSSNVIEKCIRVADPDHRRMMIDELLSRERLDKLIRDSYGNYVIQTALDYAEPLQRAKLVECIKPLLPALRGAPSSKRIATKIHQQQFGNAMYGFNGSPLFSNYQLASVGLNGFGQFSSPMLPVAGGVFPYPFNM